MKSVDTECRLDVVPMVTHWGVMPTVLQKTLPMGMYDALIGSRVERPSASEQNVYTRIDCLPEKLKKMTRPQIKEYTLEDLYK